MKDIRKILALLTWLVSAMVLVGEPTEGYNFCYHILTVLVLCLIGYVVYPKSNNYEKEN